MRSSLQKIEKKVGKKYALKIKPCVSENVFMLQIVLEV